MSRIGGLTTLIKHCGGTLVRLPVVEYVGGLKIEDKETDPDLLNFKDIVDEINEKCKIGIKSMCYLIPNQSTSEALMPLSNDGDVVKMAQELYNHGLVNLFVEHLNTDSTSEQFIFESSDDEQFDLESNDEEDVLMFDVSVLSEDDDPELIGAVSKSQQKLEVPMEPISSSCDPIPVESDAVINRQKGPGNRGKKRTKTKRKKIVHFNLQDVFSNNVDPRLVNSITTVEDNESDYFDSDDPGEYESDNSGDEFFLKEDAVRKKTSWPVYKKGNVNEIPVFDIGMKFTNCEEFKDAIRTYSVLKGCVLEWLKNDATCQRLQCTGPFCKWYIGAAMCNRDSCFRIVSYSKIHNCIREMENPMANAPWLARYLKQKIDSNPMIKLRILKRACHDELRLTVHTSMMKRAKEIVLHELEGNYKEEYACLMGYRDELIRKNPENTVIVNYDQYINTPNPVFKSIYICLAPCKKGWMEGCRKIIGIDACFLKGMCKGVLLTATGIDGNNQMYPVAWAVVDGESNETWGWFLNQLKIDLMLIYGENLVVMSDQHKAIISSVRSCLPQAQHRFCVRHLYSNWSKEYKGEEEKKMFWAIAKSTYIEQYEKNLQKLAEKCPKGFDAISELQGNFWVKAYFETDSMCDIVDNNLSEVFNAWILEARCKSITSMLEDIRHMVMNRLKTKRASVSSWDGEIAPRIRKILIESFEEGSTWTAEGNGRDEYEISNKDERRFVVNISMRNCTCRKWQLTGIPCCHAICAMHCCHSNYEDRVAHWYKRDTYLKAYAYSVDCIKGPETWKLYKGLKLEPPPFRKSKGRPRVKRIKPAHETKTVKKGEVETLSRKGIKMTCSICGLQGHNKRGCLHKNDPNFKKLEPKKLEKKKKSNDAPSKPRIVFNVRDTFCAPQATEGTKKNGKKDSGKIKQKRQKKSNQNLQGEPSSSLHGQHSSQTTECLTQGSQNF